VLNNPLPIYQYIDITAELAGNVSFVSFQDFFRGVKSTPFEGFSLKAVQNERAFEDMRSHILQMYGGVTLENVTSFFFEGQHVDCIAIKEQPTAFQFGIKHIEEPPMYAAPPDNTAVNGTTHAFAQGADSPLKLGLTDQFGNTISCPEHTIPMSRLTLERLTRFKTLRDFFGKFPNKVESRSALVPRDDIVGAHKYAQSIQNVVNFGGHSFIQLWKPVGTFSLSQQWFRTGQSPQEQSVEGGWVVYPDQFHTTGAVLFIYWTADSYISTGSYNLDRPGFIQVNHNWWLGGPFTYYSTPSSSWGFMMQWKLFNGNWWLYVRGSGANYEGIGYYPTSIYNGGQMSRSAERMDYGGEVARNRGGGNDWPPMGSGALSTAGVRTAANQALIYYIPHNENGGVGVWANLFAAADAPCYSANEVDSAYGGDWGTYMLYGGPGGDIATCGV
jgi:hypothetical protein